MDPGALSVLLADEHVCGLQVRRGAGEWVTVQGPRQRWRNDGCAPHVPRQRTGGRRSKARGDSARGVRGEAHGGAGEPSGGSQPVLPSNPIFDKPVKTSSSVRSVVLDYTENTPFPQFTLKFEYIGYLEIHNLDCTKFLEAISSCWNLQSLHLITCKGLVALPESIGKLKKLRILELNFAYDLDSLPQSIGDCRDLQSLILYHCEKFRETPGTICKIKNLRGLHISSCYFLKQFPSEFAGVFSNLQTINLANATEFQGLPSTLSCPLLCTLDLSNTKVTLLPPWITTIDTLECINLEECFELVELPKGIGNLKRLAVLNIKGCSKLRCMPSGIGQLTRLTQLGLFVVGCGRDDARISELENLDMLSGELEIRNLKYVKDPCDTEKACLKQKNGIKNLVLDWSLSEGEEELASDVEQEQGVLSGLEPPSQIESLVICRYQGPCLPRWLMEQNGSSYSEGTTLKQTGPCQYLSLTYLTLFQSPNLKHMRGLVRFPSLKSLKLSEMASLEELWTIASGIEIQEVELSAQYCFPILSNLYIENCPKLSTVKPYLPPWLEELCLRESNFQLLSPSNFSRLLPSPSNESSSSSSLHSAVVGSSSDWELLRHHTKLGELCSLRDLAQ
ncbi:uncharacterized protein LOC120684742 [Panicum virgatum]|uniref:uncharacterized protein LOC120684742 n=1 Tax=Panicum virgatum TaxID=38727 RepID=UPI0019D6973C|nr:uncharacterized protein LOC120684742 [Panicum virgatum]